MEVRELHLYSEKIEETDIKNFFNALTKAKFPLFGFLSTSDILSLTAFRLIVKRNHNTVQFYVQEKKGLQTVSPLIFPFRLCEPSLLQHSTGSFFPFPRAYFINGATYDLLDFMLKENIEELAVDISKVMGGFVAMGTAIGIGGHMGKVIITNPTKFFKINLEKNPSIYIELLEPLPKKMATSSKFPIFEETGQTLGVDNFDPIQHTLIAGTSGSGKSKALYVLLKAIQAKHGEDVRVIMVDPHGEFAKLMPNAKVVDFRNNYVEPLDVGREKSPMLTQLVSQLISSSIGQENKYSERVLFYSVYLLSSINKLELNNISLLLTDAAKKAEFVSQCTNDEAKRFFDEEYNDIHIHHFNSAILPILNFIGEYQLYLGKEKVRENLMDVLEENRMTIIAFDPKFFGRKMIGFLAGAIINQMYILAISGKLQNKKTILVVDEFPRVETKVIRDILAETRKFNLFTYLSCQYLGQLSKDVMDAIVSNVRNIIAFKINKQDAAMLSSIMEIKVEEYFKKHRSTIELEESKKEMFVRLHQRECIARLFDGTKFLLPMKLRVVDAKKWGLNEDAPAHTIAPSKPTIPHMQTEPQTHKLHANRYLMQEQKETESKDEEKEIEEPRQKPLLPEPMTELLLQETPDVIYALEKSKLEKNAQKEMAPETLESMPANPLEQNEEETKETPKKKWGKKPKPNEDETI